MEEVCTIEGVVHSLLFQNEENGYTVLRLLTEEGEVIVVVGCIPCVAPGESLCVHGVWGVHPQHGEQLMAQEVERRLPEDEEEICSYLASGILKGVGPATAQRIVEKFGRRTFDIIEQSPEQLAGMKGITSKKAQQIAAAFRQHMGLRRLMAFLAQYELPPVLAMQLRKQYGERAVETVRDNPYLLASDTCGVEFSVADEIGMSLGIAADSGCRVEAAVTFELTHNENNGHVFLPRNKLLEATCSLLGESDDVVEQALDRLIERKVVMQQPLANVQACYLYRLWEAEFTVCRKLSELQNIEADRGRRAEQVVDAIEKEQGITYAPLQRQAVELAATEGVLLLTGGPGTGKTTSIRGIVALFQRMGLDVVLTAPTGRAAKRMSELCGMEAQTIHRLLETRWNEGSRTVTFTKCEKEPLEADAVIVDEMSMVDLCLFRALLAALRPGCRLVMVGDPDQLPAVGAGNVFSDLIRSKQCAAVALTEIFRQAEESAIVRNAHAVNAGEMPCLSNTQKDFFFMPRRSADRLVSTVVELCKTRLPKNMHIPADQIQVLTPTRKGEAGTEYLNRALQAALNPASKEKPEKRWGDKVFRQGDRIMQTRNDYDVVWEKSDGTVGTGIFNGDVGKITEIDPSGEWLSLTFEDRTAVYTADQLSEVELAYAMTVHKAQGSEYRSVILAAFPTAPGLMVRGVLYTALTRARELLIVVGDDAAVRSMAANDRRQRRYSGLRWRLAHRENPS